MWVPGSTGRRASYGIVAVVGSGRTEDSIAILLPRWPSLYRRLAVTGKRALLLKNLLQQPKALQRAADEAAGATFTNFGTPTLNGLGTAAFLATVTGPGVVTGQETGIWSGNSAAIARNVRAGMPVPGDATAYFSGFGNPTLDGAN